MKKILLTIGMVVIAGMSLWAQAPNQLNYQGVARTATGQPIASATVSLRLTVLDGSATGTTVYQETHVGVPTNQFGLYNVAIGGTGGVATVTSGSWAGINWSTGNKYLEVEMDPTGGTSYVMLGTSELISAPYAMYANSAGSAQTAASAATATSASSLTGTVPMGGDVTGTNTASTVAKIQGNAVSASAPVTGQGLIWSGSAWTPSAVSGSGTVVSVTAGTGLSGGTITSSGTISMPAVGSAGTYGSATQVPVITTDAEGRVTTVTTAPITSTGGTVTSVTAGTGLSGGTITGSGTISLPTFSDAGTYGSATTVPVITVDNEGRVTSASTATISGGSGGVSGTTNYVPKFTSATAVGNSNMYQPLSSDQVGINTTAPYATVDATSATDTIVGEFNTSTSSSISFGVVTAEYTGTGAGTGVRAWALASVAANNTLGVEGIGNEVGALGIGESSVVTGTSVARGAEGDGYSDDISEGIAGIATNYSATPSEALGVVGNASNGTLNVGVYGTNGATAGSTNYAAYFDGDVYVNGTLSKAGGTFKIDHPQDPANKYLVHSFVESPDMMNIYNGNITTDASGTATVSLPSYFDALNKDFRYQLTVIGTFAQAIVSKEVSGNTFEIKTSVPNVKVSWQVTGVRQDAWANAHRVQPEVEKEAYNKGKYLNAKELNKPASTQIGPGQAVAKAQAKARENAEKSTGSKPKN